AHREVNAPSPSGDEDQPDAGASGECSSCHCEDSEASEAQPVVQRGPNLRGSIPYQVDVE
ncbi:unnamed protein product, partial [Amoebophrya sp. A25]